MILCLLSLLLGAVARAGELDAPPRVVVVPDLAWPDGLPDDAVAVFLIEVDAQGRVTAARVLSTTHRPLADAALALIDRLRFEPAVRDGQPAAGVARWTVSRDLVADDAVEVIDRAAWRVRGPAPLVEDGLAGTWTMSGGDVERVAGGAGDLAHALQAVPGVSAFDLQSTALSVRGGEPSETVWVVDGVPLQGPRSAGTLLSRVPTLLVDSVTLHGAAQPAELTGSGSGIVELRLVEPDDREVDGVVELGTGVIQGQVSAPLGRPGAGNAAQISVRRSALEPGIAALNQVGLLEGWLVRVEDAALRLRLRPAADHHVTVTGLAGRTRVRSGAQAAGLDEPSSDDTDAVLAVVRHRWRPAAGAEWVHHVAWTREGQDVISASDDLRRDVRSRLSWRGQATVGLGAHHTLVAGGLVARMGLEGEGSIQDPRTAPPAVRVPWRRMGPQTIGLDPSIRWTEGAAWLEHRLDAGVVQTRAGLRTTLWQGRALLSPRLAVGARLGSATHLQAWAGVLHQLPRDPLDLDGTVGLLEPVATRTIQAALTAQQGLGEHAVLRLDAWSRWQDRLVVWTDDPTDLPASRSQAVGAGVARGLDLSLGLRTDRVRGLVSGSLADGRRSNPLATLGPTRVRPWWIVPWTAMAQAGVRLGRRQPWDLGARVRIRAGAEQVPLGWEVRDDAVVVVPDLGARDRLSPIWQGAVRAERSGVVAGRVELSVYADVIATGGPLAEVLRGGSVDLDTGDVTPPDPDIVRDLPLVPWVGARVRW